MQFTLSLPRGGQRLVAVEDELIGRVAGDYKVGFEPQAPDHTPLCTEVHETPESAAGCVYACWLLKDLGATVLEHEEHPKRYDHCDGTCTVDCGHCKGAGEPEHAPVMAGTRRVCSCGDYNCASLEASS
jgi:hypothetical protein